MRVLASSNLLVLVLVAAFHSARAASVCYDLSDLPAVWKVEAVGDGVRVHVPNRRGGVTPAQFATAVYSASTGWRQGAPEASEASALASRPRCDRAVPEIRLTREEALRLKPELRSLPYAFELDQVASACVESGEHLWFGLGYYSGEGVTGVGGVGRIDARTETVEVRRPSLLRDASVSAIAVSGQQVWLGTTGFHECLGFPPKQGLVRYDWEADDATRFMGSRGICGFAIHDLAISAGSLWVASDLGISRTANPSDPRPRWEHFVPDPNAPGGMRAVSCHALYEELLAGLPANTNDPVAYSPFFYLFSNLAEHERWFLHEYVARQRDACGQGAPSR